MSDHKQGKLSWPAREVRCLADDERARPKVKDGQDGPVLYGHAAVFDRESQDLGGFKEKIHPKAFEKVLGGKPDVRALVNHDPNLLMGRTKSNTLRLSSDGEGLAYEIAMPDTPIAAHIVQSVNRGDMDGSSFSFTVEKGGDAWEHESDPPMHRARGARPLRCRTGVLPRVFGFIGGDPIARPVAAPVPRSTDLPPTPAEGQALLPLISLPERLTPMADKSSEGRGPLQGPAPQRRSVQAHRQARFQSPGPAPPAGRAGGRGPRLLRDLDRRRPPHDRRRVHEDGGLHDPGARAQAPGRGGRCWHLAEGALDRGNQGRDGRGLMPHDDPSNTRAAGISIPS